MEERESMIKGVKISKTTPRILRVSERKELDLEKFVKRSALNSDFSELINSNFIILYNDKPLVVYLVLEDVPYYQDIIDVLKNVDYLKGKRTQGLKTQSKIFGFSPRETIRKNYCSSTALSTEDPYGHSLICNFGKILSDYYKEYCPEMYDYHESVSKQKIMDDWRIHGTPFTSGIINKNNPLKYHFDKGNINSVYSNMVVFKKNCEGGYLSLPEFDIGLKCTDKSIVFFDGQDILHGVTPFMLKNKDSYRFSIVYYTLKQMWQCQPITDEILRAKKIRTERELRRYKMLTGEINASNDKHYADLEKRAERYRNSGRVVTDIKRTNFKNHKIKD